MTITDNPEYDAFVAKFRPKKLTTDDCYTPAAIYDAVADWVAAEYNVTRANFVRPFWPGGDYEQYHYPTDCIVVDNPPFSILSQIKRFYHSHGVRFFLFAPGLTLLTNDGTKIGLCHIATGCKITYANGARVNTSFITNLEGCALRSAPDLYERVKAANNSIRTKKHQPKYTYPDNVISSAMAQRYSILGVPYRLEYNNCARIPALDAQKALGKKIFGGGFLLSDRAAAERADAERAAAERADECVVWQLSAREREIIHNM